MSSFTPSKFPAQISGDECINQPEPQPGREHDYRKNRANEPAEKLHRSIYIVILTLIYAGLAIFPWTLLCILVHRPLGASSYADVGEHPGVTANTQEGVDPALDIRLIKSKHYLRVAKVMLSVVSILTIPLTSTVCSQAAVAFIQKSHVGAKKGHTLRQTIALADKSWTDLLVIFKLISGKWNLYGSNFLLFALFLNALGSSISPLQNLFLSMITIQLPTIPKYFLGLVDISDHFPDGPGSDPVITLLASRLVATSLDDPQIKLWCTNITHDTFAHGKGPGLTVNPFAKPYGLNSFFVFAFPVDAYWSQLPYNFSTGLEKAVMPRINSSTSWDIITSEEYPAECHRIPDALYLSYSGSTLHDGRYYFEVCMPSNITQTLWKNQTTRQDFTEALYLNTTFQGDYPNLPYKAGTHLARVNLSTTAGYFELPNHYNNEQAGPLLSEDALPRLSGLNTLYVPPREPPIPLSQMNTSMAITYSTNKSPLLSIALALFGPGSFADGQHSSLNSYKSEALGEWERGPCIERVPFASLMNSHYDTGMSFEYCIESADAKRSPGDVIASWLSIFTSNSTDKESIERAFTSAAFLAVDSWMTGINVFGSLSVKYDPGVEIQVPHIPKSGIMLVSTLLGLHLFSLLVLSLYCAWTPRWTKQLDAFAMMRLGASLADDIPFLMARDAEKIRVLDDLPGWIGDDIKREPGKKEKGVVGKLVLGGETHLTGRRRYAAYGPEKRKEARGRDKINQPRFSQTYTSITTDE